MFLVHLPQQIIISHLVFAQLCLEFLDLGDIPCYSHAADALAIDDDRVHVRHVLNLAKLAPHPQKRFFGPENGAKFGAGPGFQQVLADHF